MLNGDDAFSWDDIFLLVEYVECYIYETERFNWWQFHINGGMSVGMWECASVCVSAWEYFVIILLLLCCIGKGHT